MSIQEQFEAAVKIIQNLPKNGKRNRLTTCSSLNNCPTPKRSLSTNEGYDADVLFLLQTSYPGSMQFTKTIFLGCHQSCKMVCLVRPGEHVINRGHESLCGRN